MRRTDRHVGPAERATPRDIPVLNRLFSDAFTERYRRDGLSGVRVPFLNPEVWRYAIANAGDGAFVWRDSRGSPIAFNMVHASGSEGWMGPLAVHLDRQGHGLGQQIVNHGIAWLQHQGVTTIGLETMPRTVDNIGFYSRLGFRPAPLTTTLQGVATPTATPDVVALGNLDVEEAAAMLARCRALTDEVAPGVDYGRECELTRANGLGDVGLIMRGSELVGWLLWHVVGLAQGRVAEELRILKLVAKDLDTATRAVAAASSAAASQRLSFVSLRCQGSELGLYGALIEMNWRVQWTDLRMTLEGYPEVVPQGVLLTNWEI